MAGLPDAGRCEAGRTSHHHSGTARGLLLRTGIALSTFPSVRLRPETVDAHAWQARTVERVRHEADKHLVPVERFRADPKPRPMMHTSRFLGFEG